MPRHKGRIISAKRLHTLQAKAAALKRAREARQAEETEEELEQAEWEIPETPKAAVRRKLSPGSVEENAAPKKAKSTETEDNTNCAGGRRIVEYKVLGKGLWCCYCKECMSLDNIEDEKLFGLGAILNVRCHKCCTINVVPTGKRHADSLNRETLFDVNAKFALGVINSGSLYAPLRALFAAMNMPIMSYQTYKKYERSVGKKVEEVAKVSCEEAAKEERELTIQNKAALEQIL